MAGKDIHSDVEGHGIGRIKRSDDAEPETTDTQRSTDEPEVEGQSLRGKRSDDAEPEGTEAQSSDEPEVEGQMIKGRGAPVADIEGHGVRGRGRIDEAPESTDLTDAGDEPEVEGQCVRGHGPVADVEGHGVRVKRSEDAEPETTDSTDTQSSMTSLRSRASAFGSSSGDRSPVERGGPAAAPRHGPSASRTFAASRYSTVFSSKGVRPGCFERISASRPATCGAAKLFPVARIVPPPGQAMGTPTPRA